MNRWRLIARVKNGELCCAPTFENPSNLKFVETHNVEFRESRLFGAGLYLTGRFGSITLPAKTAWPVVGESGKIRVMNPHKQKHDRRDTDHLTRYLRLIPEEDSSAGRQRFGHLTKQGNRLMRFLLVEAARTASRYDPHLKRAYRRLAFRKGAPVARVAIARKLAIRLYIMLQDGIDYEEFCRRGPQGSGRGSHAGMLGDVALV